jgi:hypothetical protein
MDNASDNVAHGQIRGSIKLILAVMFAVPPTVSVSADDSVYASGATSKVSVVFQKCATGTRQACVVDGDTIWLNGQKIRVADIDTPEVNEPKCSSELALGNAPRIECLNSSTKIRSNSEGGPAVTPTDTGASFAY